MKEYYGNISFTGEISFRVKANNEEEAKEKVFSSILINAESEDENVEIDEVQFGLIDKRRQGNAQESFLWDFGIYEEK